MIYSRDIPFWSETLDITCLRYSILVGNPRFFVQQSVPCRPRLSYREQFEEEDEEADRGNDGKTTSKSGLAFHGTSHYGKLRTERSGGSWL